MPNRLFKFILEQADLQPLAVRIQVYRDLAEAIPARHPQREPLLQLAEQMEQIDANTKQMLIEFP